MAQIGIIVPENGQEEMWNLAGRVNALHDFIKSEGNDRYTSTATVCAILGFTDLMDGGKE